MRRSWPDPGDEVAAQLVQLALAALGLLQLRGHAVEVGGQARQLVAAADGDTRLEATVRHGIGAAREGRDLVRHRGGEEVAERDGDARGKDEQDDGQREVVLVDEHEPRRPPDVDKGEQAGEHVAGDQRPAQAGRPVEPAEAVGQVAGQDGDGGGGAQEEGHGAELFQRRLHHAPEDGEGDGHGHEHAAQEAQGQRHLLAGRVDGHRVWIPYGSNL